MVRFSLDMVPFQTALQSLCSVVRCCVLFFFDLTYSVDSYKGRSLFYLSYVWGKSLGEPFVLFRRVMTWVVMSSRVLF